MPKLIQDFWILRDGMVLCSRVFNQKVQGELFAGLLSTLDSFANEISKSGLSSFNLGEINFTVFSRRDYIFVANSDKKINKKKLLNELYQISDKFFLKYNKQLHNWEYNISHFQEFEEDIKEYLEEVLEKFKKAFW